MKDQAPLILWCDPQRRADREAISRQSFHYRTPRRREYWVEEKGCLWVYRGVVEEDGKTGSSGVESGPDSIGYFTLPLRPDLLFLQFE